MVEVVVVRKWLYAVSSVTFLFFLYLKSKMNRLSKGLKCIFSVKIFFSVSLQNFNSSLLLIPLYLYMKASGMYLPVHLPVCVTTVSQFLCRRHTPDRTHQMSSFVMYLHPLITLWLCSLLQRSKTSDDTHHFSEIMTHM